jgi:hypothetical protein
MAETPVEITSLEWYWRNHGFGEFVIPAIRKWRRGEKVLDAGCGYSPLPLYLAETFGVEMWSADDFGGADPFWRRGLDPSSVSRHSKVRHIYEPIGKEDSSLPAGYFDAVYTKLGIHISPSPQLPMWRHFGSLLSSRRGSSIYVLANIGHLSDGEPSDALNRFDETRRIEDEVATGLAHDGAMPNGFWESLESRLLIRQTSAYLYAAFLAESFGATVAEIPHALRAEPFCSDAGALIDPHYAGLLQSTFTRNAQRLVEFDYGRRTAVLFQFDRV